MPFMFQPGMLCRMLLFLTLVLLPVPVCAIPTISISSPAADGTFILRGEQMTGVAGMDITIGYDYGKLTNPRILPGSLVSGMMSASNPGNPVRLAVIGTKPLTGSGIIATISFDLAGTSPGAITALTGSLIDAAGKSMAISRPAIANPAETGQTETQTDAGYVAAGERSGAKAALPVGGTLTLPAEEERPGETGQSAAPQTAEPEEPRRQPEQAPQPVPGEADASAKPPAPPKPAPRQPVSVLERFRQFQGERSVADLCALFTQDGAEQFSQLPPVGIADGKATVTLIIPASAGERAPNFAFNASRFVSFRRTAESGWGIEVMPEAGAVEASVTMLQDGSVQEIPLTVTPRAQLAAGAAREVTEADFLGFLKDRGTPSAPRFDLNHDGRRDYVDDYIFTANYLARHKVPAQKGLRESVSAAHL